MKRYFPPLSQTQRSSTIIRPEPDRLIASPIDLYTPCSRILSIFPFPSFSLSLFLHFLIHRYRSTFIHNSFTEARRNRDGGGEWNARFLDTARFPRFPDPPYFRRSGKLDSWEGRGGCGRVVVTATCRNGCTRPAFMGRIKSHRVPRKTFVPFNMQLVLSPSSSVHPPEGYFVGIYPG